MTDNGEGLESLKAKFKERQLAEKFKLQDVESKLEQAQAVMLRLLDDQRCETTDIKESLDIAGTCVTVLKECVSELGGTNVEITAMFPEGKMAIDKLSQ